MLGQKLLALVAGLLRLEQAVLEMLLALVQSLHQGFPGESAQKEKQADEHDDRPDDDRGLHFHGVGLLGRAGAMRGSSGVTAMDGRLVCWLAPSGW